MSGAAIIVLVVGALLGLRILIVVLQIVRRP
jgi:hypothetical protein